MVSLGCLLQSVFVKLAPLLTSTPKLSYGGQLEKGHGSFHHRKRLLSDLFLLFSGAPSRNSARLSASRPQLALIHLLGGAGVLVAPAAIAFT